MKVPYLIAVALVLSTAIVSLMIPSPSLSGARSPYLSLDDVIFLSPTGPEGQVPVGNNTLAVVLSHDPGEDFIDRALVNVTITHWFGGDLYTFFQEDPVVFIGEDQVQGEIRVGEVLLEEGEYNLSVSMNISGLVMERWERISVEDIVDIGVGSAGLEDLEFRSGKGYRLPYEVTYQGNVEDLHIDIVLEVSIWSIRSDGRIGAMVFETNETLLGSEWMTIDPGDTFKGTLDEIWVPTYAGRYSVRYDVEDECPYDNHDDIYLKDRLQVELTVHPSPEVQGWVSTGIGTPESVRNITVRLEQENSLVGYAMENMTDEDGYFAFYGVPAPANYTLKVWSLWSTNCSTQVHVEAGRTVTVNCSIYLFYFGGIRGIVDLPVNGSAGDVTVEMIKNGAIVETVKTTYGGYYEVPVIQQGSYDVRFHRIGFTELTIGDFLVYANTWNPLDVNLSLADFNLTFIPRDDAVNFDVQGNIHLVFSRPIDTTTVNGSTVWVEKPDTGERVPLVYQIPDPGNVIVIDPKVILDPGTRYIVVVTGSDDIFSIRDIWGDPFPNHTSFSFRTVYDYRALRVIDSYPGWSPGGVPVDTVFRLYLSEAVDPSTVDNDTFMLLDESDLPIDGTMSYDETEVMLMFAPSSPLGYDTEYELVLTEDVRALMPGAKFEGYTRSFRTVDPPPTYGTISGIVLDRNRASIPSYRLTVEATRGVELIKGSVNVDGYFTVENVPVGTWWLRVTGQGYSTYLTEVDVTPGGETDAGTILLDRTSEEDPTGEEVEPETDGSMVTICVLMTLITLVGFSLMLIMLQKKKTAKPGTGPPAPASKPPPPGSSPFKGFEVPVDRIAGAIEEVFKTPSSAAEAPPLGDADGSAETYTEEGIEPSHEEEPPLDEDMPMPEIEGDVPKPRLLEPPPGM